MESITVSVDDSVLAAARRHAAQRSSTIDALVRDYLASLAESDSRASAARSRLRGLSEQSSAQLGKVSWTRDELHDR